MEKPRKIQCSLHIFDTKLGCPECGSAYAINGTIDAMSTWIEGEVPSAKEMARVFVDYENENKDCSTTEAMSSVHALLLRKLKG